MKKALVISAVMLLLLSCKNKNSPVTMETESEEAYQQPDTAVTK